MNVLHIIYYFTMNEILIQLKKKKKKKKLINN